MLTIPVRFWVSGLGLLLLVGAYQVDQSKGFSDWAPLLYGLAFCCLIVSLLMRFTGVRKTPLSHSLFEEGPITPRDGQW